MPIIRTFVRNPENRLLHETHYIPLLSVDMYLVTSVPLKSGRVIN